MSELPSGWSAQPIGEIGTWRGGGTPSKANHAFWKNGKIPWVSPKDMKRFFISETEDKITSAAVEASATQLIPEGSILLVIRSGILRHSLPVAVNIRDVTINQDLKALSPNAGIDPVFIGLQVRSLAQEILGTCAKSGTTVDSIDFERLKSVSIRVPPLPEQRRIVAKIDTLSVKSERARGHLNQIPRLVEKYKQAILAAAFGETSAASPQVGTVEDFLEDALIGLVRSKTHQSQTNGTPYIRMNHFDLDGVWNDDNMSYVSISSAEALRYELAPGDILFNTRNSFELVGKVAVWPEKRSGYVYNNNLLRLRFDERVLPAFAFWWMISPQFRGYLQSEKSATTSVCAIYQRSIMTAPFYVPDIELQKKIVSQIKTAFTWIDRLAFDAISARNLIDHLDQAVLAKAFRGELVPQDPNDEPASVVLERIRTERAKAAPIKREGKGRRPRY